MPDDSLILERTSSLDLEVLDMLIKFIKFISLGN